MAGGYDFSGLVGDTVTDLSTATNANTDFTKILGSNISASARPGSITFQETIPQPDSLVLMGLGVAGIAGYEVYRRRRVKAATA